MHETDIESAILGSSIEVKALPAGFFMPLFAHEAEEAPTLVAFAPEGGQQKNAVRDLVRKLAFGEADERSAASRGLAVRLASVTSRRSPDGLFIVLVGDSASQHRVVLWKFPVDESIQAQLVDSRLTIRVVDDAFSRRSTYFKSAMFEGTQASTSFWTGKVEDRQAASRVREVADFWVQDFLACRPSLTDVHGTRILANALRETIRQTEDMDLREALISVVAVLRAQPGRQLTLVDFAEQYLPEPCQAHFLRAAGGHEIWGTPFRIDGPTLADQIRIRSLTLNEDFVVRGPVDKFDTVVSVQSTSVEKVVRVSLEGTITSQAVLKR
jgi:hypothetical protein